MPPDRVILLVRDLLRAHPALAITPGQDDGVTVEGELAFHRILAGHPDPIVDSFQVRLLFPPTYPKGLPDAWEIGERIPKDGDHHVNFSGSLCLGNPLRIRLALAANPSPVAFVERFVIPYLCGVSVKLSGGHFPQGELDHGTVGLLRDGMELLGLANTHQASLALLCVAARKFRADRSECPCGCGRTLSHCQFGPRIDVLRRTLGREWAREYVSTNRIEVRD